MRLNVRNSALSEDELERYSRQMVLSEIGHEGQLKLKKSSACIVGLGGLGSLVALQLAAMGVGHIRLVDQDFVELSNLHRQLLYSSSFIGYPKVEVAAKRLKDLNPNIEVEPLPLSIDANNAEKVVKGMNVIMDGLDRMGARYAVNRACQKLQVPYIFAAALATFGNITTIIPGETPCLECFYGNVDDDKLPTTATAGIHTSLLSIVTGIEVSEAIRIMLDEEALLANKLFYCNIRDLTFDEIPIVKWERCPVCGSNPAGKPMPIMRRLISEAGRRRGRKVFRITPKEYLDLDLDKLASLIVKNGFKIMVKAQLGITFYNEFGGTTGILKSGITVVEGAKDEKEAYASFSNLIIDELGISESKIV